MKNKCKQCGNLNKDEAQFCDNCGTSFSGNSKPIENITKNNDIAPAEQTTVMTNKTKGRTKQIAKVAKIIIFLLITVMFFSFLIDTDEKQNGSFQQKEIISTEDAKKVFENRRNQGMDIDWTYHLKDDKIRINKFEKTNGQSGAGVYLFEYLAEMEVLETIENTSNIFSISYEEGEIIQDEGTLRFEMTERGWRGEDGSIIEVNN